MYTIEMLFKTENASWVILILKSVGLYTTSLFSHDNEIF